MEYSRPSDARRENFAEERGKQRPSRQRISGSSPFSMRSIRIFYQNGSSKLTSESIVADFAAAQATLHETIATTIAAFYTQPEPGIAWCCGQPPRYDEHIHSKCSNDI
jgi:hypothetical protein